MDKNQIMREDEIYLIAYLAIELFNYVSAYIVIFGASVTKSRRKIVLAAIVLLCIHLPLLYWGGRELAGGVSMLSMCIIPALILESAKKKYYLFYPFIVVGTSVVGICISFLIAAIFHVPEYLIVEGNWMTIVCQCMQGMILFPLVICKKIGKNKSYEVCSGWKQYGLFYIAVACLYLMLAPLQEFTRTTNMYQYVNWIGFAVSIICIVLVLLTVYLGVVVSRENQWKEREQVSKNHLKQQRDYYVGILHQDEKMRRFRHDMKAHFAVLQSYCGEDNHAEMREYLDSIIEKSAVYDVKSYTGNIGVDAIIWELERLAGKYGIQIQTEGYLTNNTAIEESDLCTIVFNLLKNAIEACEKVSDVERKVVFRVGEYCSLVLIQVENPVEEVVNIKNNQLISTKTDTINHGLGSGNVESVVKKYQGSVEYKCEDGWFTVELSIDGTSC